MRLSPLTQLRLQIRQELRTAESALAQAHVDLCGGGDVHADIGQHVTRARTTLDNLQQMLGTETADPRALLIEAVAEENRRLAASLKTMEHAVRVATSERDSYRRELERRDAQAIEAERDWSRTLKAAGGGR